MMGTTVRLGRVPGRAVLPYRHLCTEMPLERYTRLLTSHHMFPFWVEIEPASLLQMASFAVLGVTCVVGGAIRML